MCTNNSALISGDIVVLFTPLRIEHILLQEPMYVIRHARDGCDVDIKFFN